MKEKWTVGKGNITHGEQQSNKMSPYQVSSYPLECDRARVHYILLLLLSVAFILDAMWPYICYNHLFPDMQTV